MALDLPGLRLVLEVTVGNIGPDVIATGCGTKVKRALGVDLISDCVGLGKAELVDGCLHGSKLLAPFRQSGTQRVRGSHCARCKSRRQYLARLAQVEG